MSPKDTVFDYDPVAPSARRRASRADSAEASAYAPSHPEGLTGEDAAGDATRARSSSSSSSATADAREGSLPRRMMPSLKRGHALSFVALFLYATLAYFRPYELSPALAWTLPLPYWLAVGMLVVFIPTQFALEGTLTARPREVNLALLLCAAALLSIPLAVSREVAWQTFNDTLLKAVIFFVVMVNAVRTQRRLRWMIFLALVAGLLMCASSLGGFEAEGYRARAKVRNMFGEPNAMALHLAMMTPIAAALLLGTRNVLKKLFYGASILLMVVGTLATFSRGGFLALACACAVLAWKLGRRNRLLVVLLMAFALLVAVALAPGGYGERLASIFDSSRDLEGSATARQALLLLSVKVALLHPLLGVGIGNFSILSIKGQVTHNAYTQVASEMGMLALAAYVMFIIAAYKRLRRIERETFAEKRRSQFYYLAVGLQASLVGYMVGSFFLSVAYEWNLYFLVGYGVCLHRLYEADAASKTVAPTGGSGDGLGADDAPAERAFRV